MEKQEILKQYKAKAYDIFADLQFLQQELGKVNEEIRKLTLEIQEESVPKEESNA